MIQSAAVVIFAVLFLAFLGDRFNRRFWLKGILCGVVFGTTGMIAMATPVELSPGLLLDARSVIMAFSGAVGGPVSAVITAAMLTTMRVWMGGSGTIAGIVGLVLVAVGSSALWAWLRYSSVTRFAPRHVVALATIAAVMPVVGLYWAQTPWAKYLEALALIIPTNFIGVLLLGFLIVADGERRWALKAYSDSRARLQSITNNVPAVLFQICLSPERRIVFRYISGGAERMLGVAADVLMKRPEALLRMLSRPAVKEVESRLARSAADGRAWSLELELTRPNGSILWVRAAAEPREDVAGQLVWDGSLFDITEQKRSEHLKNDFISIVSHELRTPLTSIRGSLGLVAAGVGGALPEKAAGLIRIAHSNSERLVRLINDILDIEKIESGRMPFDIRPMALAPLVQQSIDASGGYLADRGVEVALVEETPDVAAQVDPDRLHQVMLNMLSNAIKYSPAKGRVEVLVRRRDGVARISVKDEGPGIPEEFHARIFGTFEQADSSDTREKGGTGLGLSIVKAIVERLNGSVSFETTAGVGSIFHVDLPGVQAEPAPVPDMAPLQDAVEPSRRVLICESEPDIAGLIREMLGRQGIAGDVAPDLETARALLASNHYLAATLDLGPGGESGIALFRELRSMQADADLPVIVISAVADDARKTLNGSVVGIIDWLDKPVDATRLGAAIARIGQQTDRRPAVLHVEDDEDMLKVMSATLGDQVTLVPARSAGEARRKLQQPFDLVILDLGLPDGSGADLLGAIPNGTPVVIFSALEVDEALAARVTAAMTKTKTSEITIADLVRTLTATASVPAGVSLDNTAEMADAQDPHSLRR